MPETLNAAGVVTHRQRVARAANHMEVTLAQPCARMIETVAFC